MTKGGSAADGTCRVIQVMTVHMPSRLGHTPEDIEHVIRNFAGKARGNAETMPLSAWTRVFRARRKTSDARNRGRRFFQNR